jgi:hypothetical protein
MVRPLANRTGDGTRLDRWFSRTPYYQRAAFTPLAVTWALAVGGIAILLAEKFVSSAAPIHLKPSP